MMTAKEFLKQYENKTRIVNRLKEEYAAEVEMIDAVRSTSNLDGMPHGNGIRKPVEDRAIRLADKAAAWKIAELDAIEARQQVFEVIHDVPDIEGDILFERYINLKHWEEVCVAVHLSWTQTHERHKRALRIIQTRISNTE